MPNLVEVLKVIDISPDIYLLRMKVIEPENFTFKPGQFISFPFQKEGKRVIKSYSISTPPSNKDYIETCIKIVPNGFASNYLHNVKPGERLEFIGPSGTFVLCYPLEEDTIFAATGTGISPLRSMIHTIFENGTDKKVWLFYGSRYSRDLAYHEEFQILQELHENFRYIPIVSREPEWPGEKGHIQDHLPRYIKDGRGKDIYICGVLAMVNDVKALAEKMGFEKNRIHTERYI